MRAQPKRLGNEIITGSTLAALATAYVDAINHGAVPTIATAWQVDFNFYLCHHRMSPFSREKLAAAKIGLMHWIKEVFWVVAVASS